MVFQYHNPWRVHTVCFCFTSPVSSEKELCISIRNWMDTVYNCRIQHNGSTIIRIQKLILNTTGRAIIKIVNYRLTYRVGLGSIPEEVMQDLWWAKWHYGGFILEHFSSPCQFSLEKMFHTCSTIQRISAGRCEVTTPFFSLHVQ
jgi:hypothetical protein